MIIKRMDSKLRGIEELEIFLKDDLTPYQRSSNKNELKAIEKGVSGEKDSAYYINFYFGDSENWGNSKFMMASNTLEFNLPLNRTRGTPARSFLERPKYPSKTNGNFNKTEIQELHFGLTQVHHT